MYTTDTDTVNQNCSYNSSHNYEGRHFWTQTFFSFANKKDYPGAVECIAFANEALKAYDAQFNK